MSFVQARAEAMIAKYGFLGVPTASFESAGRHQLETLVRQGLTPASKVLEIGCGCLRAGCWLIGFLDPGGYCGIEPARQRVQYGLEYLVADDLAIKRPRFDFNATFDTSVFQTTFDFFLAGSIWTHASKAHIKTMLDGFVAQTVPGGCFLASYLPAEIDSDDYTGHDWVGTSHESQTRGVIRHSLAWIDQQCRARGLQVDESLGDAFDGQFWLRIRRPLGHGGGGGTIGVS
jgi:hypothetical protein